MSLSAEEEENFVVFRDCLSAAVIEKLAPAPAQESRRFRGGGNGRKRGGSGRKNAIEPVTTQTSGGNEGEEGDAEELGEFIDYLANEIFPHLPETLRHLSYTNIQLDPSAHEIYSLPLTPSTTSTFLQTLPASISESLTTYLQPPAAPDNQTIKRQPDENEEDTTTTILLPILTTYIPQTSAPPPSLTPTDPTTCASSCELCEREHLPLTYHHLIPRAMHAKVLKRNWHPEWALQKVAWLCRACHSFVHRVATNEELAREYYEVGLLWEREDVRRFAGWVGRVRWKAR